MFKCTFQKVISPKFGHILLPVIPATIIGPKRKLNTFMLLDSGADFSIIPYSAGKTIGLKLDMKSRSEVHGIGEGSVPYIINRITLQIGNMELSVRIGWALIEEVPFILGRLDIFNKLAIEFREFDNKIILKQPNE